MPLRERVREIFKKYGVTVTAIFVAAGVTIGAVVGAITNALKSMGNQLANGLKTVCWAGAGSPGGCHRKRSHPTTPNKVMHVLFKESGAATPHIQEHHQSLANCLLVDLRYLYFIKQGLSDIWGIFLCLIIRMRVLNK